MTQPDLTYRAVTRQLQGMRAEVYELGVLNPATNQMCQRTFPAAQVVKSLSWLKSMNSQGCHVYIRPQGSQGLILVDDLTQGALNSMKADGFAPAVIVETSPLNFQAWVRLSETPLDAKLATLCARLLAQCYEGDPASADWRHYGRLAGFTNRKPAYAGAKGRYPFVKLHVFNGHMASKAPQLLTEARQALEATQVRRDTLQAPQEPFTAQTADPLATYTRQLATLKARYGAAMDESVADWMIAKSMARHGFTREAIAQAILEASPDLDSRKRGHVEDYVTRTLDKVMHLPEVVRARHHLSKTPASAEEWLLFPTPKRLP